MSSTITFRARYLPFLCLAVLTLAMSSGCDSGPPTAPVHGQVTYQGEAVPRGTIRFYPDAGGAAAVGQIQSDGTYSLSRKVPGDDVLLGSYKVTIEAVEPVDAPAGPLTIEDELKMEIGMPAAEPKSLVPEKYLSIKTTDLTATVEDKDNQIDFALP